MAVHAYAIVHRYGPGMVDHNGQWIGKAYQFETRTQRDAFVDRTPNAEAVTVRDLRRNGFDTTEIMDPDQYDNDHMVYLPMTVPAQ